VRSHTDRPGHDRSPGSAGACLPAGCRPHRPEQTLLYRVVAGELDALREALAAANPYGHGLPRQVDKELEAYLRCGILLHG
jgi:hypothetical protein